MSVAIGCWKNFCQWLRTLKESPFFCKISFMILVYQPLFCFHSISWVRFIALLCHVLHCDKQRRLNLLSKIDLVVNIMRLSGKQDVNIVWQRAASGLLVAIGSRYPDLVQTFLFSALVCKELEVMSYWHDLIF